MNELSALDSARDALRELGAAQWRFAESIVRLWDEVRETCPEDADARFAEAVAERLMIAPSAALQFVAAVETRDAIAADGSARLPRFVEEVVGLLDRPLAERVREWREAPRPAGADAGGWN